MSSANRSSIFQTNCDRLASLPFLNQEYHPDGYPGLHHSAPKQSGGAGIDKRTMNIPAGIYLLKVVVNRKAHVQKMVK